MRPLLRFLRHVLLAAFVVVAGACILEVGLRGHRLHQQLNGGEGLNSSCLARPCPIAYQHLPPRARISHVSADSGETIEVSTNALGLRGDDVQIPKPVGRFRIVCLGDEATLAPDIAMSDTFCQRLAERIGESGVDVDVVNAAQPGYCPLLSLAWCQSRLIGLQPDLVVFCCDVSDVQDDRHCRPLAHFDETGESLTIPHPAARQGGQDWAAAVKGEFLVAQLASQEIARYLSQPGGERDADTWRSELAGGGEEPGHPEAIIEQAWEPLADLNRFCQQVSADFVIAIVPSSRTVETSGRASSPAGGTIEIIRLLSERAMQQHIPLLNASPEFTRQTGKSDLFLRRTGTLSPNGHQLFAEILTHALLERGLSESRPTAIPVSGTSTPEGRLSTPLPNLERRPRQSHQSSSWDE